MCVFNYQLVKSLKICQLALVSQYKLPSTHCWKGNSTDTQRSKLLEKDSFICSPPNSYNHHNNSGKDSCLFKSIFPLFLNYRILILGLTMHPVKICFTSYLKEKEGMWPFATMIFEKSSLLRFWKSFIKMAGVQLTFTILHILTSFSTCMW